MKTKEEKVMKYIQVVKSANYKKPDKNAEDYTEDEVIAESMYHMVNNDIQCTAAVVVVLRYYTILYPIFKKNCKWFASVHPYIC